jgi:hypothetical protein
MKCLVSASLVSSKAARGACRGTYRVSRSFQNYAQRYNAKSSPSYRRTDTSWSVLLSSGLELHLAYSLFDVLGNVLLKRKNARHFTLLE